MKNILILLLFCWSVSFGQSVPNSATFTIGHVMFAVYGDSAVGRNTATVFADSNTAYFDATYGSKTMSPQTINGFRHYGPPAVVAPTVTTAAITVITRTTATGGGNVTADGGASVTARGVCWNTSTNPTTANSKTTNGTGTGSFTSDITGLTAGSSYYARAYATNSAGTGYGSNVYFYVPQVDEFYTQAVTDIAETTATSGVYSSAYAQGNGIVWSTSPGVTWENKQGSYNTGVGSGLSVCYLSGLTHNTLYYVRGYRTLNSIVYYADELSFTTAWYQ